MKSFFLSLTMALFPFFAPAQSFDALWKAEQKLEADGKPQSAYNAVQAILKKAIAEGHQGQAMSARLRAAALHQEWAPDSFFTDVAELEALRAQETRPEARAIYASILAEVYEGNRNRSQSSGLQLTSEEMKEWTREQYDSAAVMNWRLSLADISALSQARSKVWLPFVTQQKNSTYFNHDLLHILWQRVRDRNQGTWQPSPAAELAEAVKAEYVRQGNREAQLLMDLDMLDVSHSDPSEVASAQGRDLTTKLLRLKDIYADMPLCTEIYLRLLNNYDETVKTEQKVAWAEEALKRYPRYERIGEVHNILNELRRPWVKWRGNDIYYPGKEYTWEITTRNATAVTFVIYRLKDDFKEEEVGNSKLSVNDYFRRHGTEMQKIQHSMEKKPAYETTEDSLRWKAPEPGRYVILYTATTDEKGTRRRTVTNQYQLFRVTSLKTMHRFHDPNKLEVIVVDAESGQPIEGATVNLCSEDYRTEKRSNNATQRTNAEGRAFFQYHSGSENRQRYILAASTAADHFLPEETLWPSGSSYDDEQTTTTLRLYTDRAIYRPGQTVHLSGIAYSQKHWDASALAGKSYELILRNANWKEVSKQTAVTDSLGVLTADFVLPEGELPGNYRIQTTGANVSFRVEEYKRPTFEVKMDEAPALQWPQDSIELTGKALGYNGVPVRDARVTGHYQFTYPYFWWFRHEDSPELPIDTIATDENGIFRARVPLNNIPSEALRFGLVLRMNVEVLSAAGETREGVMRVPLCTTPLRLNITMQEQQDRDRLQAPLFSLITSTGKSTRGEIRWSVVAVSAPASSSTTSASSAEAVASGAFTLTAEPSVKGGASASIEGLLTALRTLPSGDYELRASAQAGNDTASSSARFYLFSMDDTRLPRSAEQWLYCPSDTFDAAHPARIQVGSSFKDVALYYSLVAKEGVVKNELIQLSDELRIVEIPYLPEYGDGVTAHLAFVKGGTDYRMSQSLKLTMPSKELRWQWTSFRDRLHPGDHETWTLRLTDPDGKPVSANLMATIYDASLDQLTPHSWNLIVNRYHRVRQIPWRSQDFFASGNAFQYLYFTMKDYKAEGLAFDSFDASWINGLTFSYGYRGRLHRPRMMRASRAMGGAMDETDEVMMEMTEAPTPAPMMMAAKAAPQNAALQDRIAGLSVEESEDGEDAVANGSSAEGSLSTAPATLRTNFNETAAFLPRLHSNPVTGEVTLSFTLPESLTTWQLLGMAHTSDLFATNIQAQTIARKELMARLYLPRFLRAGDESSLRAIIQNLTESDLSGQVRLEVFDPETENVLVKHTAPFTASANDEAVLAFEYTPSEDYPIVAVRLTAETTVSEGAKDNQASFSDGEQLYLPILSSKEYITESVEIQADGAGTFTTDLSSLFNHDAPSATQRRLTVEYTTHPIWNVVQALPALREPQHDDVLSLTSIFYANTLAAHIAATTPRLHDIITLWKQQASSPTGGSSTGPVAGGSSASESPLSQNDDLKQLILDETPWLREADSDAERRAQLIDLFNENLLNSRIGGTLQRLNQRQESDGGFAWFPGMRSSELMTRLVAIEITRLRSLTDNFSSLSADSRQSANNLLHRAFAFIAKENNKMIQEMKKAEAEGATIHTGALMHLHYVYISQRAGVHLTKSQQADVRYLLDHLKGSVAGMTNDERAVAAIILKGDGRDRDARLYFDSMREHMTTTPDHGTFFDYAGGSFTPTGHKVLIHTAAMEAVRELTPDDQPLNSSLRRWLLQQKRTQMWESSICTTDAIYALLHGAAAAADLQSTAKDHLTLNYSGRKVSVLAGSPKGTAAVSSPAALGYIRETYFDGTAPRSITVQRNSPSEAWGAVYAQYLTPIAEASAHASRLTIRRELSNTAPRLGDKFTTRYIITADRDYEYVCLRADRPAAAEPAEQLSGYRYQGGLGYYRAVRDAHTDYFFDRLPKGTYVLEETSFIDRTGNYTTGLCRIQCLYAPEYEGHTAAMEVKIKE